VIPIVILSVLGTSVTYILLGRLVLEVTGSSSHLSHCTVGLSGPLFALKVVTLATGHPLSLSSLYEVAELAILAESNSRLYHICGLVCGLLVLLLGPFSSSIQGEGRRLGSRQEENLGQPGVGRRRSDDEYWTRSWGYRSPAEVGGMRGLTPSSTSPSTPPPSFAPSAPLLEEGEPAQLSQPGAQPPFYNPETLAARPPQYAQGPAPPPPGPGYRLEESQSRSITDDELRRRRLERFS